MFDFHSTWPAAVSLTAMTTRPSVAITFGGKLNRRLMRTTSFGPGSTRSHWPTSPASYRPSRSIAEWPPIHSLPVQSIKGTLPHRRREAP